VSLKYHPHLSEMIVCTSTETLLTRKSSESRA
jgi:hypothetical protein